ncbi:hypothetical protein ACFYRN_45420 [Streptomyces sp. NPDC005227]|uniref:hypothetical protein n=1 Tax=Streptomyces sp. NPDC005227 TaxID=3364707 RepID=UPI00367670C1
MNRVRLLIHRLLRRPSITGPMRFHTRRLPDGVLLDLEDYFLHVVTTITDDPEALALLLEIAEDRGVSREHDGWEPERLLMERLIVLVGHEIPVRGKALARLAARLTAAIPAAPLPIPAPREATA